MRIEIGQDARGRWAWMVFDDGGKLIASEDCYEQAAPAMKDALRHAEAHVRRYEKVVEAAG